MEHGTFTNFLYANTQYGAPPGKENEVYTIHAYKSKQYVTGFYAFTADEMAEINKTGGLWISFMGGSWPPVRIDAGIPMLNPTDTVLFGQEMVNICHPLAYLDLNILVLEVQENEGSFAFRLREGEGRNNDGGVLDIWDMEYRTKSVDPLHGTIESGVTGGKYLFGEDLEILGRLKDLPRLQPLQMIYPMLSMEHLILMHKDVKPPPPIFNIDGVRIN